MESEINGTLVDAPLSEIKPNPNQIREFFDPDALNALTESIKREGNVR